MPERGSEDIRREMREAREQLVGSFEGLGASLDEAAQTARDKAMQAAPMAVAALGALTVLAILVRRRRRRASAAE